MRPLITGIALLALLAMASPARADTAAEPYAGITVEQLYDSNVQNTGNSDEVTRVTPRLGLLIEGPRLKLDADYRIGFFEYAEGTVDNTINHRAALVGKAMATERLTFDTRMVLTIGSDPILLDRPGIAIPEGGFDDFEGHVGMAYRATRRLTLDLSYLYRRSRFDEAEGMNPLAFDGDEHRVDGDAAYRLSRRLTMRILARAQHFVSFGTTDSLGNAVGGGAGLDYALGPNTLARADAGPLVFTTGGTTWFALAQVQHRGERMRWTLAALRDVYGGTSAAEAVWAESVQAMGAFRLTRRIDLRVHAAAYRNGPAPDFDSNVTGLVGRVDAGYSLFGNNARFELYGEHRSQDVSGVVAFDNIQRTIVGVRLVAFAGADLLSLGDLP